MSGIGFKLKRISFDQKIVINAKDRATRRVLMKFGSFVRRTAKQSIRKGKAISVPGKPPKSHSGELKKLIFFSYEPRKQNVVIGPLLFRSTKVKQSPLGLEALEYGGFITHKRKGTLGLRSKRFRFRARPFMAPAFEKEHPKLSGMWKNSIR